MLSNNVITKNKKPYLLKRISRSFQIFIFLLFSSTSLPSQNTNIKLGIFYKVSKPGVKDTSCLFGTYHLINDSYLSDLEHVNNALKKTKGVVVETIIDPSDMQRMQAAGMMQNKLVTDFLDKPLEDSLNVELTNTLGVDLSVFNQLKPINIVLTLSVVHLMNNNKILQQYKGQALDAYFADYGKSNGKNITTLETMDDNTTNGGYFHISNQRYWWFYARRNIRLRKRCGDIYG